MGWEIGIAILISSTMITSSLDELVAVLKEYLEVEDVD